MCGARVAAALLPHVNLLLMMYGGAALATAARLRWDPSTYVALREVFPAEYRAAAAALAALGAATALLAHCGTLAAQRGSRLLLLLYSSGVVLMTCAEVSLGVWLWRRAAAWLDSESFEQLQDALELRQHLRPLLVYLARWHPLPHRLDELIQEAEADAPVNGYIAAALCVLLFVLQPLAAALALVAATRRPTRPSLSQLSLRANSSTYRARARRARSGDVLLSSLTFVVRIYYSEKRRTPPPPPLLAL